MELAIGNSTFYVDRILFGMMMQFCWTMLLNISAIFSGSGKKDIFVMTGVSLVPVPIILALFGDFVGVALLVVPALIACGVVFKARRWVGFAFAMSTVGCFSLLLLGALLVAYKTHNVPYMVIAAALLVIFPAGFLSDAAFRRRVESLPRRATRSSRGLDDGSCSFGDDGGFGFGRSGGF